MERQHATNEFQRLQALNDRLENAIFRLNQQLAQLRMAPFANANEIEATIMEIRQTERLLNDVRKQMDDIHFYYYGRHLDEM